MGRITDRKCPFAHPGSTVNIPDRVQTMENVAISSCHGPFRSPSAPRDRRNELHLSTNG